MTKEQVYKRQMEELGIWEDAFAPEVATLAQLERDLTRAKKAWSATAAPGEKPSVLDPLFGAIAVLRRDILAHRDALGLTPKGLRKLRGQTAAGPSEQDLITERLDLIAQRVSSYDEPADGAQIQSEWDELQAMIAAEDAALIGGEDPEADG